MTTSKPSVESTTIQDTEYMLQRVELYRQMVILYAGTALREKEEGRTVAEAEWLAIQATNGLTKSIPIEMEVRLAK